MDHRDRVYCYDGLGRRPQLNCTDAVVIGHDFEHISMTRLCLWDQETRGEPSFTKLHLLQKLCDLPASVMTQARQCDGGSTNQQIANCTYLRGISVTCVTPCLSFIKNGTLCIAPHTSIMFFFISHTPWFIHVAHRVGSTTSAFGRMLAPSSGCAVHLQTV